ncbi:MAG TPA: hypothetical protein VEW69_04480 [Alphaproteobacteria bacterium]|nr:hypothetical protein [Alphaproteobacteria bacterium]
MKTKTRFAAILAGVLFIGSAVSRAQHGEAPDGYYPRGYMGDTWTGQVSAVDPDKREITLTAATKKGPESFVAYLPEHFSVQQGGKGHELQMSEFAIGQSLRLFYIAKDIKVEGQKVKRNEIIKIESLAPTKRS